MAISNVQIANYALTMLGAKRINALNEDVEQARQVNAVFDLVRDACLIEHEWNFAVARATLPLLATTPEYEWDYEFTLPNDCLRVISTDLDSNNKFAVEGRKLLTNTNTIKIKYVKEQSDPTKFSSIFTKYFSTRLAEELAFPLTGSRTLEQDMYLRAEKIKTSAFGLDSVEGTPEEPIQDDWRQERYSGY